MSPLSHMKYLLKGNLQDRKHSAFNSYFKQLRHKQALLQDLQKKNPRALVDPIGYYENRYFPNVEGAANPWINRDTKSKEIQEMLQKQTKELRVIREYERNAETATLKMLEAKVESDFDHRN